MEDKDTFSAAETARRRDAIVRNMIATPPAQHTPIKGKRKPSRDAKPAKKARKSTGK
jgi:hypothetical protein